MPILIAILGLSLPVVAAGSSSVGGFAIEFTVDETFVAFDRRWGVEEYSYSFNTRALEPSVDYCTVIHLGTPPEKAATDFLWAGAPIYFSFGKWAITERSITYIGHARTALIGLAVVGVMLLGAFIVLLKPMSNIVLRLIGRR